MPVYISIDSAFNLYINDYNNNRIIKYTRGSSVGVPLTNGNGSGLSQVSAPFGSVIDIYGNLYVSDAGNSRIMKYSNISLTSASPPITGQVVAGGSLGSNYSQLYAPWGLAVDASGNVYISDHRNSRVMKWTPGSTTGTLVAGIGNGTVGNGSRELSGPMGIFLDQNLTLYIADFYNDRIQKWPLGSTTGTTVAGDPMAILAAASAAKALPSASGSSG
ncbi:unnamed protein product [Rotaria sp. Silwood1]|nr:unnamed protein product [Rotaria sp. Silwood1]